MAWIIRGSCLVQNELISVFLFPPSSFLCLFPPSTSICFWAVTFKWPAIPVGLGDAIIRHIRLSQLTTFNARVVQEHFTASHIGARFWDEKLRLHWWSGRDFTFPYVTLTVPYSEIRGTFTAAKPVCFSWEITDCALGNWNIFKCLISWKQQFSVLQRARLFTLSSSVGQDMGRQPLWHLRVS